ncbi:MAG: hypothetical protein HGB04_08865 [Chlorobiaceae bacterium]|nr:hypothetical protein [Chlorobiaceae bacterium]
MNKKLIYGVIAAFAMSGVFSGVSFAADAVTPKPAGTPKPAVTSPAAAPEPAAEKKVETTTTEKKPVKKSAKKVKKAPKTAVKKVEAKPAEAGK